MTDDSKNKLDIRKEIPLSEIIAILIWKRHIELWKKRKGDKDENISNNYTL